MTGPRLGGYLSSDYSSGEDEGVRVRGNPGLDESGDFSSGEAHLFLCGSIVTNTVLCLCNGFVSEASFNV